MKKALVSILLAMLSLGLSAQQKYFVDGYHGGVYGHYPMAWYTQFIVDQLAGHPEWYIGLEIEPETWDSVKVRTPGAYEAFKKVAGGRQVEFTNPTYAQSYLYCLNGESVIRQFQYGIRKVREHFPDARIETYSCEEPCFTSCLPTVLPMFGIKYLSLKCPDTCWGGYAGNFGGEFVNLIGPDGTSMPCVPRYECEALQEKSVWQTTAWSNNPKYWKACEKAGIENPVGMCFQDAGWKNGQWIGYDNIKFGTKYTLWSDYFERYYPTAQPTDHRFSIEDVKPGLMWGSQILQTLAQNCRHAEINILQTEKLLAMARLINGYSWDQSSVDEAWRELLLSQHHDCWIVPYNRLNKNGNWADNIALWTGDAEGRMALLSRDMATALEGYFGNKEEAYVLFNTTGSRYKGVVRAYNGKGKQVFIEADIPAFGYLVVPNSKIPKVKDTKSVKVSDKECVMENDLYSLTFDLQHGGIITSLKDKKSGYDYALKNGNYSMGELRGFFADPKVYLSTKNNNAKAVVLRDNELCKSVQIQTKIDDTDVNINYTLNKGSKAIDCNVTVMWKENHHIGKKYDSHTNLNMMFATSFTDGKISKAAPFDVCESELESTEYSDWHEIKHNLINEWIDLKSASNNKALAVFCDHTTSYSYSNDYPLALTVQYSGGGLWGKDYKITKTTSINYAIVPHEGSWAEADIWTLSNQWSEKPLVMNGAKADGMQQKSFLDLTGTGKELTSVTLDNGGLKARIFNAATKDERFKVTSTILK